MLMAQYTTFLNTLLESGFDIGLNDYPIWDEDYRPILNSKIIDNYRFREIGSETPGLFKYYLNRTMHQIMPYYNELYKTTQYDYNPIHNVDYTEEHNITRTHDNNVSGTSEDNGIQNVNTTNNSSSESDVNSSANGTNSINGKTLKADTPQSLISVTDIDNANYASEVGFERNNINTTSTGEEHSTGSAESTTVASTTGSNTSSSTHNDKGMNTEEYVRKLRGNYGVRTTQQMIKEERDLIINIDMQVIRDLEDCFLGLF